MWARRILPLLSCCTLVLWGCTRQSAGEPPLDPAFALPTDVPSPLGIERPAEGDRLESPFLVRGTAPTGQDLTVAVQVKSRADDGEWRWLGNQALDVDEEGRFEGEVAYSLEASAPGAVELMIIDQESGSVLETSEVGVELDPSP
jgi:hypothetical protein